MSIKISFRDHCFFSSYIVHKLVTNFGTSQCSNQWTFHSEAGCQLLGFYLWHSWPYRTATCHHPPILTSNVKPSIGTLKAFWGFWRSLTVFPVFHKSKVLFQFPVLHKPEVLWRPLDHLWAQCSASLPLEGLWHIGRWWQLQCSCGEAFAPDNLRSSLVSTQKLYDLLTTQPYTTTNLYYKYISVKNS